MEKTTRGAGIAVLASAGLMLAACAAGSDEDLSDAPGYDDEYGELEAALHGGIPVGAGEFSPVVKLDAGTGFCSGVKIGATRFLTAGHCISISNPSPSSINLRTSASGNVGGVVGVTQVRVHPSFKIRAPFAPPKGFDYDLAIIDINQTTSGNTIAGLPGFTPVPVGTTGLVVGYGENALNAAGEGHRQRASFTVTGNPIHSLVNYFDSVATASNNVAIGPGDSGGAFFTSATNLTVRGIVSTGPTAFNPQNPANNLSGFIRVGNVLDWIADPQLEGSSALLANQSNIKLMNIKQSGTAAPNTLCLSTRGRNLGADTVLDECDNPNGDTTGNPPGWTLVSSGSSFRLVSRFSGACLGVPSAGATAGTALTVATCGAAGTNQSWNFSTVAGVRAMKPAGSSLCVGTDAASVTKNTRVLLQTCNNNAASEQAWLWIR